MISGIINRMLHLDSNDDHVKKLHDDALDEINQAVIVIKEAGKLQERLVKKTTTYYLAKATGSIKYGNY